jgi:hypothetical protein
MNHWSWGRLSLALVDFANVNEILRKWEGFSCELCLALEDKFKHVITADSKEMRLLEIEVAGQTWEVKYKYFIIKHILSG